MNKHLYKTFLLAGGLALALPLALHAGPHGAPEDCGSRHSWGGHEGYGRGGHLPHHLKDLNLTDDQRTRIGEILKAQGQTASAKFEAARKIHEDLRKLALSSDYTEDKARTLGNDQAKAAAEIALERARVDHEIYQLLTPEQQAKLKEKIEKSKAHAGQRGHEGWPPKPE